MGRPWRASMTRASSHEYAGRALGASLRPFQCAAYAVRCWARRSALASRPSNTLWRRSGAGVDAVWCSAAAQCSHARIALIAFEACRGRRARRVRATQAPATLGHQARAPRGPRAPQHQPFLGCSLDAFRLSTCRRMGRECVHARWCYKSAAGASAPQRGARCASIHRRRSICKVCGGAGICERNRIRSICKDCGGASTASITASRASARTAGAQASASITAREASARGGGRCTQTMSV